jgi:RNA polymerase sigma-70 factor, ECF subfamily
MQPERRGLFEAIVDEVGEPLRRYLVRRVDPETAQDVLADALLVIWRRLDDVPQDAVLAWCYAVTRNCLANAQRSTRRQHNLVVRLARMPSDRQPDADPGSAVDQLDVDLHRALDALRGADRELLMLWAWEDLDPGEIATVLGVTVNAVHIRLHRARRRLADLLEQREGERDDPAVDRNSRRTGGNHERRPEASAPPR